MTTEEKKSLQRTTVYFKPDIFRQLKILAVAQNRDASALINDAISEYVERNKSDFQKLAKEISEKQK